MLKLNHIFRYFGARCIRAPFLFSGFLVFISATGFAQKQMNAQPKSQVKPVSERARELVLEGRRYEAIRILAQAYSALSVELDLQAKIEKKSASSLASRLTSRTELLRTWDEIANVFLSDKAQNQFALAESLWLAKPKEAVELLQSVLPLEIGNVSVALLGARAALRSQDCSRAETFVKEAEKIYSPSVEVRLLRMQLQACLLSDQTSFPLLKFLSNDTSVDWGELDSAVRLLVVRDLWRRKDIKAAKAAVIAWETQAPEDPEVWYWKWKTSEPIASKVIPALGPDVGSRDRTAARNYLRICHEMTPRRRKMFSMHPELCLATEFVESDLKSSEKSGT